MLRQSSDDLDRQHPILEHLVVQGDEERPHILCLGEMSIEAFFEVGEDDFADVGI